MAAVELTPSQIVAELDKYIVGQTDAKRAVAVAIRNRWRRQQLPPEIARDIAPKNLILIGPTGVGKTEIARRLALLTQAPFIKVEASKFTEVGYVGRDVESIVRDLIEAAVNLVGREQAARVKGRARDRAEGRVLDLLVGAPPPELVDPEDVPLPGLGPDELRARRERLRVKLKQRLHKGELESREVEITVQSAPMPNMEVFSPAGVEQLGMDFQQLFSRFMPKSTSSRRLTVREAREHFIEEEAESLVDKATVTEEAIHRVENTGIVFLDELDKVAGRELGERSGGQPQISREGVQRDLLPIIEGSTVNTRYGPVKTDHVLFIAAGAFHITSPADLIPELQGRFPVRVELKDLTAADFVRILVEPKNALIKQYRQLLAADGLTIEFTPDGIEEVARIAAEVNTRNQNIGARRLHTILERLLDDAAYQAPEIGAHTLTFDREAVFMKLAGIIEDDDLSRYVL